MNNRINSGPIEEKEKARIEYKWKEYNLHIDLYKFYLALALRASGFFYLILGGVLTIYFSKDGKQKDNAVTLFLLLPIAMSVILGIIFIHGGRLWKKVTKRIDLIRDDLELYVGVKKAPDVRLLYQILWVFGISFFGVGISLVVLMIHLLLKG